jgi:hypothetical protein
MTNVTMKLEQSQPQTTAAVHLFDNWFDPIEAGLRDRVREFIHAMVEGELDMVLSRPRYARCAKASSGEVEGAGGVSRTLDSFCRETPGLNGGYPSYLDGLGTKCQ